MVSSETLRAFNKIDNARRPRLHPTLVHGIGRHTMTRRRGWPRDRRLLINRQG